MIALAWNAAGAPGLILLKLACTFGALAVIGATLKANGVTGRAQLMLLGLALVGILPRVTHVRPQLFSVVLFAALLRALTLSRARANGQRAMGEKEWRMGDGNGPRQSPEDR